MQHRPSRVFATLAALCIVAFGTSAALAQVKPLDPPQTLKMAYVPIMKFATAYVAASRGLFDKYGLKVDFERVKSGTEAIAFLNKGSVDVGGIAIVTSLWNGWNRGLDLKIIAPGALEPMQNSPTGLFVRKALLDDGKVKAPADLKGLRLASSGGPGSGGEYLAAKALARGGLSIRDVSLINIGNADMPQAMERGAIDAALAAAPYSNQMIEAGTAALLEGDLTPGLMTVAFVGSTQFLAKRPEVAERFVLALTEAARLMQGEQYLDQPNIDAYLRYTNTTEQAIRQGARVLYDPMMKIPVDGLADVEATHRSNGRTDYDKPLDLSVIYDDGYVTKAVKALATK